MGDTYDLVCRVRAAEGVTEVELLSLYGGWVLRAICARGEVVSLSIPWPEGDAPLDVDLYAGEFARLVHEVSV